VSGTAGPPPGIKEDEEAQSLAKAIADVSERASVLVREEIELAKAEVSEKAVKLAKGAVVGVAAGIFFVMALIFALVGCAWLLYYYLPGNDFTYFWGFFAMAVILIVLGVIAGLVAAKVVKAGAPPMPTMAIEEAQKIREAVRAPSPISMSAPAPRPEPTPTPADVAPEPAAEPDAAPAPPKQSPENGPPANTPEEGTS
jgi:Putative Actinobacterial Holin-X, holin superfamily III